MNKVKIGVIGAGWWATENHIPHLAERDEVELTSVCKLEEDQLSFVKNKFNFKHFFADKALPNPYILKILLSSFKIVPYLGSFSSHTLHGTPSEI